MQASALSVMTSNHAIRYNKEKRDTSLIIAFVSDFDISLLTIFLLR